MLTFFSSNLFCCLLQILRSLRGVIFWWYVGQWLIILSTLGVLRGFKLFNIVFLDIFCSLFLWIYLIIFVVAIFSALCSIKWRFVFVFIIIFLVNFIIVVVFFVFFCSLVLAYFRFGFPYCGGGVSSLLLCHYKQYWPRFCCCKFFVVIVMNILRIFV